MHVTPFLIDVRTGTFDGYVESLAKTGRKNFRYAERQNSDITYRHIDFDPALIERFMRLWEEQEIAGQRRQWAYGMGFLEFLHLENRLLCFSAEQTTSPSEVHAVHLVERHGSYVICHPPMYDKRRYAERYLAKFMWFHLIRYAIEEPDIDWLDLGGGNNGSWRDLVRNREHHDSYKWLYVPERIKAAPDAAPEYWVKTRLLPYSKELSQGPPAWSTLRRRFVGVAESWLWLNRRRRINKIRGIITRRLKAVQGA